MNVRITYSGIRETGVYSLPMMLAHAVFDAAVTNMKTCSSILTWQLALLAPAVQSDADNKTAASDRNAACGRDKSRPERGFDCFARPPAAPRGQPNGNRWQDAMWLLPEIPKQGSSWYRPPYEHPVLAFWDQALRPWRTFLPASGFVNPWMALGNLQQYMNTGWTTAPIMPANADKSSFVLAKVVFPDRTEVTFYIPFAWQVLSTQPT